MDSMDKDKDYELFIKSNKNCSTKIFITIIFDLTNTFYCNYYHYV